LITGLAGRNVDRRQWQVLASLARRPTSRDEVIASPAAFAPPATVEAVLNGRSSLGWIEDSAGLQRLTADGAREHPLSWPLSSTLYEARWQRRSQDDYITHRSARLAHSE
jgi:hypothetical protein